MLTDDESEAGGVIALFGELDIASASLLERGLKRLQWAGTPIVVDLSGLDFIDSTGLHVLLRAAARAPAGGFSLLRAPERVQRIFSLTATGKHLPFVD
jgi:anti-anti-sigma factor